MMYNVHIGFPKISFKNLRFIGESVKLLEPTRTYLLPQHTFQNKIRPIINNFRTVRKEPGALRPAKRLFKRLSKYETVSISHPGLLGASRELLLSERAMRRGAIRISALSELLADNEITFHIAITRQAEYIVEVFGEKGKEVISESPPFSWKPIIEAIANAAPDRSFVVWNFEKPEYIQEQFLCELMGQKMYYSDVKSHLSPRYTKLQKFNPITMGGLERELEKYDDMFEDDLDAVAEIEGVTVVSPVYSPEWETDSPYSL